MPELTKKETKGLVDYLDYQSRTEELPDVIECIREELVAYLDYLEEMGIEG